jgi:hypothetical protein
VQWKKVLLFCSKNTAHLLDLAQSLCFYGGERDGERERERDKEREKGGRAIIIIHLVRKYNKSRKKLPLNCCRREKEGVREK